MILVLGGTADSVETAQQLWEEYKNVMISTATEYGMERAKETFKGEIIWGRKDKEALREFCITQGITMIVDVTHPYAKEVSCNAIGVAQQLPIPYIRYERPYNKQRADDVICCKDYAEAASICNDLKGIVFLSTGSNQIEEFTRDIDDMKRIRARVLPQGKILRKLEGLGFTADQIIAMKGPFTEELNRAMFKQTDAKILILKQSGRSGGEDEKIIAARKENMQIILILRPEIEYPIVCSEQKILKEYIRRFY